MDRDYTTQAEEEYMASMHQLESINHQMEFSITPSISDIPSISDYSQIHADIVADNAAFYCTLMSSGLDVFEKVRQYDSQAAAEQTVQDELEDFKIRLQAVRSLMKIPPLGHTAQEINYNLGRYGRDTALAGSIFGDSLCYAETVEAVGFVEQAENSRAYYERILTEILHTDADGTVFYDMEAIRMILAKDAGEITAAEYAVIAIAYLYMNQDDMETLFCDMMTLTERKDYNWFEENIQPGLNDTLQQDYYEWTADDEKWNGFTQGLSTVSLYNLAVINALYEEHPDEAEAAADFRYTIVQRQAIADAMFQVHQFRAPYGDERPSIEIAQNDMGEYNIQFYEHYSCYNQAGLIGASSLHESNIHIGACMAGDVAQYIITEQVCVSIHEYVAPDFTSEGFAGQEGRDMFIFEHILGFGQDCGLEYIEGEIGLDKIPFLGTFLEDTVGVVTDYEQGRQDAAFVELASGKLREANIYDTFDCDVVMVTYDTDDIRGDRIYVEAGKNTIRYINKYNQIFGENITLNQIIHDPISVNDDILRYVRQGRQKDIRKIHD